MYSSLGSSTVVAGGTAAVLAHTGASPTVWAIASVLLVTLGTAAVLLVRRRAGRDKSFAGA